MSAPNDALKQIVRDAGGIVHRDGNIFFTNAEQFQLAAIAAASDAPPLQDDKDAERLIIKISEAMYDPADGDDLLDKLALLRPEIESIAAIASQKGVQ